MFLNWKVCVFSSSKWTSVNGVLSITPPSGNKVGGFVIALGGLLFGAFYLTPTIILNAGSFAFTPLPGERGVSDPG
jgi:hypothetical protein